MPQLCSKELCTGCSACFNSCNRQAIQMTENHEGFLSPHIDESLCVDCGLCEKACPILNPLEKYEKIEAPIASISNDVTIRKKSSSGGMFTLFANEVFKRGGIVFGVVMDDDNVSYHTEAKNAEELKPMLGSKYMQSEIRDTYRSVKKHLKDGTVILYTGTPCQIAGLRTYLGKTNQKNLITVDLVCHGVPSSKMFRTYLNELSRSKGLGKFSGFTFRELDGWGITPSVELVSGKRMQLSKKQNLYMRLFLGSYLHRPSCYNCLYATQERISDITIADFWHVGKEQPFNADTKHGVSLVLTNTDKGKKFYKSIQSEVFDDTRTWEEALKINHQLYRKSVRPVKREKAIEMLLNEPYEKTYYTFCDNPVIRLRRFVGDILRFLHLRKRLS